MIITVTYFANTLDPLSEPSRVTPRPARRRTRDESAARGR